MIKLIYYSIRRNISIQHRNIFLLFKGDTLWQCRLADLRRAKIIKGIIILWGIIEVEADRNIHKLAKIMGNFLDGPMLLIHKWDSLRT